MPLPSQSNAKRRWWLFVGSDGISEDAVYDSPPSEAIRGLHEGEMVEVSRADSCGSPRRGDDVEAWLKRMRHRWPKGTSGPGPYEAIDWLLDRYRECSDYGLTLRPEDDEAGDP